MSLAPAVLAVLPALKPPPTAPVAGTSLSSGGVSTPALGAGSPRPRRPSAARARIGCTAHDAGLSGLDDLRRQMTAAHPAPVETIPIPYTKGRPS
jgi:hypothetical protein